MEQIQVQKIGVSHYAPSGANAINLYATATASELTLPQLVAAVSLRTAAHLEARSVTKMNAVTAETSLMTALGNVTKQLAACNVSWETPCDLPDGYEARSEKFRERNTIKNFMVYECDIAESSLPSKLSLFDDYMAAFAQLKPVIDSKTTVSQETMIQIQTCLSRRDIAFQTSSNIIKSFGVSMQNAAGNL